ncbi:MAG: CPXCG motif-containing cysteine-rich protein [Candidatus Eremiobacteraeota bacterium]|nr:CPXCG motif-containing cysteine-rich protein [Candidatus Eremiobacteraeota bacterium]MDQ6823068.1 CPXCG motif-containing cysteine-rich protein [Candidatus Eremiobacteraeota bacterium]
MPLETDVAYPCPFCGVENFLGIDPAGGSRQRLIEDCPVCCNPISFTVHIDRDGDTVIDSVQAEG